MKKILFFLIAFIGGVVYSFSQVTFNQTSTSDFIKGSAFNMVIANNEVKTSFKTNSISDWTATVNLPQSLVGHQMISSQNFVYLLGGFNGSSCTNAVYKASIQTNGISAWENQNSLPEPLRDFTVVAISNKIYVFGGRNTNGIPSNKIYWANINNSGNIETWNLSTFLLPQPIWGHKAQHINGFIYLIGGSNSNLSNSAINAVYLVKINTEGDISSITATTNLPEDRNGHSIANYNNKVYIIGGFNNSGIKKNTVYYSQINNDGTLNTWQSANPLPMPISNHISTYNNGYLSVIGGEDTTVLSNKFYYTDIENTSLNWQISDKYIYDRTKDAATFLTDGKVYYAGGLNLIGSPSNTIRYVNLSLDTASVKMASFISNPFVIGDPKNIQKINYTLTKNIADSCQVFYRVADTNKVWSNWLTSGNIDPVMINQTKSFLQYKINCFSNSTIPLSLNDVTLTVTGYTQLCGNLNSITTLTAANSPYWATCDISFTSGFHSIEAGVTILFLPNTGLEIGQASVNFNGTDLAPIKLNCSNYNDYWNGLVFNSSSSGVSSYMSYTIIDRGGNANYTANICSNNSNQPTINHCIFKNSKNFGIRLESSNIPIIESDVLLNKGSGLYLYNSNPLLFNFKTSNNGYAGIFYANAGLNPSFTNCKTENNFYGIYSPTPDNSFIPTSSLQFNNNQHDIAIEGGYIYSNRNWKYFKNGYAILGDITLTQGEYNPRLTIDPGTTIKVASGKGIFIGRESNWGGELYAQGKLDSIITFTSLTDTIGGWNGLYFNDGSDYNSTSILRYCNIKNANDYNIYSVNTNEPHIQFSTIQNSVNNGIICSNSNISIEETTIKKTQYGITLNNSSPSFVLTTFDSISNVGIYMHNESSNPSYFSCNIKNTKYGIYYPHPNFDIPTFTNINFQNLKGAVAIQGGNISLNRIWHYNNYPYIILNNILIAKGNDKCQLIISPGNTLKFEKNSSLQIGENWGGGELFAEGALSNPIKFTPLNDTTAGWNGLYFHNNSDAWNSSSSLKNCIIEKANSYNIWCNNTNQPKIDSCEIKFSNDKGLFAENAMLKLSNANFINNTGYGLFYNNAYYVDTLVNLQFNGNKNDGVVINGGDISENRMWNYFGNKPYILLNDIRVIKYQTKCRLEVKPGCTLKFAKNSQLQIGHPNGYGGELFAEGMQDSIITISSLNDTIGGWNGIYFDNHSDEWTAKSSLKNCLIEKANQYNIYCYYTNQPKIDSCVFRNSVGIGIQTESSSIKITNSEISNNGGIGIYASNSMLKLSDIKINNNTNYGLYYNHLHYVDSLYNLNITGNQLNGVVIQGGHVVESRLLVNYGTNATYYFLDNTTIGRYADKCRLTIQPGICIKFAKNSQLQIGHPNGYGGELFAEGKQDSIITILPLNDTIGGWNGIYFDNHSDEWTAKSSLKYCFIEKANQYNIYCSNTNQPKIDSCEIRLSNDIGIFAENAMLKISNTKFINNKGYGLYYNNAHYIDTLFNLNFTNNNLSGVVIAGGSICENRTWMNFGSASYNILSSISLNCSKQLELKPGIKLKFAKESRFDINDGKLLAIGNNDSIISFTAINDSISGWNGMYFSDGSDNVGLFSSLKYCLIEKSKQNNIYCSNTNQPKIDSCEIRLSNDKGIFAENAMLKISNSRFTNNIGYGLYYNNAYYVDTLTNLQFTGNMNNGVVINGGDISENRAWYFFGNDPYILLENLNIYRCCNDQKARLSIKPGCCIKINKNKQIQIGYHYYSWGDHWHLGELFAIGTHDSLITFTALNDTIGGWNGIYFHHASDEYASNSSLKYTKVEKGNQCNIWCNNTSQPTFDKTIIEKSNGYGLWLDAANNIVKNSKIANNNGYGVYITNGSNPTIGNNLVTTCDIYNNTGYNIYNNTGNTINMAYNFIGGMDSSFLETKIYDKTDNIGLGKINFTPLSFLPSQFNTSNLFYGKLLYDNNLSKPIKNTTINVKDYLGTILTSTQTNNSGSYSLNPVSVNVPNKIEITPTDQYSGLNATDALQVLRHFTHQITFDGNHSFIADVNKSNTVNGTDAMLILKKFAGTIPSFATGDLQIDCDSTYLSNDSIRYHLSMLWFGDVNASYIPASKSNGDINLVYEGNIQSINNEEISIPLRIKNDIKAGAISLSFEYPENQLEITEVDLKANNESLLFSSANGVLQTGWFNLDAIKFSYDEDFLIIKAKLKTNNSKEPILFKLNEISEFADSWANPIKGITLSMPEINPRQENPNNNSVLEPNYPNPVNGKTEFIYHVDEQAVVTLSVYNMLGQKVVELVNETKLPGKYTYKFNASELNKGIYIYRIILKSATNIVTDERKMIVE